LSNHMNTICTGLGYLQIFRLFLPSPRRPHPQIALSTVCMLHLHPSLLHFPFTLFFLFPFLLSCHRHFDNLYTCSSAAGARRGRCLHSLCTCPSAAGARRGCCLRLCILSFAAGARRICCPRSLCNRSSRRKSYCCSLCDTCIHTYKP